MLITRVSGPSTYAITLAEAKAAARVDHDDDDTQLTAMLQAAHRAVAEMSGRALTQETWRVAVGGWHRGPVVLPRTPVQSISSIKYWDSDDTDQTATVSDFYLMQGDDRAIVRPKAGTLWPSANTRREDAIRIEFVAGYAAVPETLKRAVMLMVAHLYEHREAVVTGTIATEMPLSVQTMIGVERVGWAAG